MLVDQQKWLQAQQYANQAVKQNPNLMDVRRINAYVLESLGDYNAAIIEYQAAVSINPNLTFLYISIGKIYRHLELYDNALDYFDKAANINEQIGRERPHPLSGDIQHLCSTRPILDCRTECLESACKSIPAARMFMPSSVWYITKVAIMKVPSLLSSAGSWAVSAEQSCEVRAL